MNKRGHTLRVTIDVSEARLGKFIVEMAEKGYQVGSINIIEEVPLGRNTGGVTSAEIILSCVRRHKGPTPKQAIVEELASHGKKWPGSEIHRLIHKEKLIKGVGRGLYELTPKGASHEAK